MYIDAGRCEDEGSGTPCACENRQVSYCLLCDDRDADLVVRFELVTFRDSWAIFVEIHFRPLCGVPSDGTDLE